MKKFVIEDSFLNIFPNARIGIVLLNGIDGHVKDENKYVSYLRECEEISKKFTAEEEFTDNPTIRIWRDAFYKFKTKKGARCSIEALLKRVSKGGEIGSIIPLVDIYNGLSLKYGVPVGGEDIDKFDGDIRLTVAEGGEYFVTYGSDKDEPALEGEVVYKDNAGAICRCWNWRESVRTMLTEETTNAFMIVETVEHERDDVLDEMLEELGKMATAELGGTYRKMIASKECPELVIVE